MDASRWPWRRYGAGLLRPGQGGQCHLGGRRRKKGCIHHDQDPRARIFSFAFWSMSKAEGRHRCEGTYRRFLSRAFPRGYVSTPGACCRHAQKQNGSVLGPAANSSRRPSRRTSRTSIHRSSTSSSSTGPLALAACARARGRRWKASSRRAPSGRSAYPTSR